MLANPQQKITFGSFYRQVNVRKPFLGTRFATPPPSPAHTATAELAVFNALCAHSAGKGRAPPSCRWTDHGVKGPRLGGGATSGSPAGISSAGPW